MNRLSQRISEAVSGVRCPGCEKYVTPTMIQADPTAEQGESKPGQRWSFIWTPPSGEVCPECSFPLARYARRAKWLRLFAFGIVVMTLAVLLAVLNMMGDGDAVPGWLPRVAGAVGGTGFVFGLVGLIVGGRRPAD